MARAARTDEKWGPAAITAGFTLLPNHLIGLNQFVAEERHVTPTEMFVLLQLLSAWWQAERLPFPSKATIARRTGLSPRQIQRAMTGLEEKQYLRRVERYNEARGRMSNYYNLSGLVQAVTEAALAEPQAFRRRAKDQ
jgi:hypothetical protein